MGSPLINRPSRQAQEEMLSRFDKPENTKFYWHYNSGMCFEVTNLYKKEMEETSLVRVNAYLIQVAKLDRQTTRLIPIRSLEDQEYVKEMLNNHPQKRIVVKEFVPNQNAFIINLKFFHTYNGEADIFPHARNFSMKYWEE